MESEDYFFSMKTYNQKIKSNENYLYKCINNRISFPNLNYKKLKMLYDFDDLA